MRRPRDEGKPNELSAPKFIMSAFGKTTRRFSNKSVLKQRKCQLVVKQEHMAYKVEFFVDQFLTWI